MRYLFLILSLALIATSCSHSPRSREMSQLEIRQIQTHVFDTDDYKLVMKAMLNVLQDEGYVVNNVDLDLGFLTATKEVDIQSGYSKWVVTFSNKDDARYPKERIINMTANVSKFGDQIKVRVNFQVKVLDNQGAVQSINQVRSPEFYTHFFSKVSKSIFIQQENI